MSKLIWEPDEGVGHVAFDDEFFKMDRISQLDALCDWKNYLENIYDCMCIVVTEVKQTKEKK